MDSEALSERELTSARSPVEDKPSPGKVLYYLVCFWGLYAVIGWTWETVFCSLRDGHFVARGFLAGPYCPIYGFGIIAVLYIIHPFFQNSATSLFLLSALVVTILELLTSILFENVFHLRLWNYSRLPFDYEGRVSLPVSVFWGLGCVFLIRFVQPRLRRLTDYFYDKVGIGGFYP